ncbi:unnamed protein product [Callosobruchus maculatus]|uniref:Secreted protein n=1 Tax=Callosobruchus maculatus TaxID=64391 RepID=A0A653DC16_CALMS|nr:unnamed protein product [Callosobruchus maculatus]
MFAALLRLLCTIAACYGHTHTHEVDPSVDAAGSPLQDYTVLLSLNDFKSVYCSARCPNFNNSPQRNAAAGRRNYVHRKTV